MYNFSLAEDKISTTPLINLDKIKPSFEELNDDNENSSTSRNIKKKKNLIIHQNHLMRYL